VSAAPPDSSSDRGAFGSRLGFILAAAGSAVGLGNIWRFPYMAGENGGGAFVALYLTCVLLVGLPVMLCELSVGRAAKSGPVGALGRLAPGSAWPRLGQVGVLTGFGILAFYSVIAGWTLGYLLKALTGEFSNAISGERSGEIFASMIGDPVWSLGGTVLFMFLTVIVVQGGVSEGIERASKILMPAFFGLLLVLAVRSMTLPGASRGIDFLFHVDFGKITGTVFLSALGQALFSLSLGMGAMITYGSYFPRGENVPFAAVAVGLSDTAVALLGGLVVFPALFAAGVEPASGPGLVFVVLPTIFGQMPAGIAFAVAFYVLLAIAALTSTISLLETVVAYFVDERGWQRKRAAWMVGAACALFAVPSALSQGAVPIFTRFLGPGLDWLSVQNLIFGNYSLSLGAAALCVFVGWRWGAPKAVEAIEEGGHPMPLSGAWGFLVRYVCPVALLVVFGYILSGASF
jgi:NSS family neurotransmitter:Na+ symporter